MGNIYRVYLYGGIIMEFRERKVFAVNEYMIRGNGIYKVTRVEPINAMTTYLHVDFIAVAHVLPSGM